MSSPPQNSISDHSGGVMSLALASAVCVILFVAVCVACSRRHGRIAAATAAATTRRHDRSQPLHTVTAAIGGGLGKAEIASLPTFSYRCPVERSGGGCSWAGDAAAQCVVCLSAMAEGEKVRILPRCRHVFHVDCVDMWLLSHPTCPLCRTDAKPPPPAKSQPSPPASVVIAL